MASTDNTEAAEMPSSLEERAAAAGLRRQTGEWTGYDQRALD